MAARARLRRDHRGLALGHVAPEVGAEVLGAVLVLHAEPLAVDDLPQVVLRYYGSHPMAGNSKKPGVKGGGRDLIYSPESPGDKVLFQIDATIGKRDKNLGGICLAQTNIEQNNLGRGGLGCFSSEHLGDRVL